ncbi:PREDICTED: putative nuclease HARBI1 [Trachymyrmex cornetzi]|uniref:putative nuclease HARBI1 n=1 Tax=Trachymyrmex cornetzi TaxID=471704 RepID=UPI00084F6F06|nr:PREDICTED: putative nuclease HARBI1 [Trachymyrmex cornetzi]
MKCPNAAGSTYYNYKGFYSIVLMAVVSASYRFMLVDIGAQGHHSNGGIFLNSTIGQMFHQDELDVPMPSVCSTGRPPFPYMLVADEAFQLNKFTLRPYPGRNITEEQKIFNYRLSRARRVVENAFGIMVAKFRILQKPLTTSVETSEKIVKAIIVLHNFLLSHSNYCPELFVDNSMLESRNTIEELLEQMKINSAFQKIGRAGGQAHSQYAANIREEFKNYFLNEGAVPWQWNR